MKDLRSSVFHALQVPVLVIDRELHIVDANAAACRLIGRTQEQVIDRLCHDMTRNSHMPCWDSDLASCPAMRAFSSGSETREIRRHVFLSKVSFEEIIAVPIRDASGTVRFVAEELRDVSETLREREILEHLRREVRTLRGIIPICASCKKIRDDDGYWHQVESYVRDNSHADFSHSYCPDCAEAAFERIRRYRLPD